MKDWLGTPITPGCRVLYHQHDYTRLGRVVEVDAESKRATVRWERSKLYSMPDRPGTVSVHNLTVVVIPLTPGENE